MSLDFADRADIRRWKKTCEDHRKIAERWPAYDRRMINVEEYKMELGPWRLVFCLEIWNKPMWHGSASIQEQIAYETVTGPSGEKLEVPQDALLAISSWVPEHYEQARFILAEMFGPILRSGDKHQPAQEFIGLFTLQWRVPYEGEPKWKNRQN